MGIGLLHSSRELAVGKLLPLHCPQHCTMDKAGCLVQKQWNSDVKHLWESQISGMFLSGHFHPQNTSNMEEVQEENQIPTQRYRGCT